MKRGQSALDARYWLTEKGWAATEKWLPIPGFGGRYEASDKGRIRSFMPYHGDSGPRILAPYTKGTKGHLMVGLQRDAKRVPTLVHRAVLAAHVGPPPADRPITRHLDGNPKNNSLSNLAYGTHSDNELDAVRHGTHNNASKTHCPRDHPYDESNTIVRVNASGGRARFCRTCAVERERQRRRSA